MAIFSKKHLGLKKQILVISKKIIYLPFYYLKAKVKKDINSVCIYQNMLGFFSYLIKRSMFEEYKRSGNA